MTKRIIFFFIDDKTLSYIKKIFNNLNPILIFIILLKKKYKGAFLFFKNLKIQKQINVMNKNKLINVLILKVQYSDIIICYLKKINKTCTIKSNTFWIREICKVLYSYKYFFKYLFFIYFKKVLRILFLKIKKIIKKSNIIFILKILKLLIMIFFL